MAAKDSVREENYSVGADQLIVLKGGSGKPLLVLSIVGNTFPVRIR